MTDHAEQPPKPSRLAAVLQLEVAVQQLLTPGVEHLDRSRPEADPAAAEVLEHAARVHGDQITRLRTRHAEARARGDKAGARRAIARMLEAEHAYRAADQQRRRVAAVIPSLLARLQAAVESTQGHGSHGGGTHRSPIGLDAAELLGNIERTVGPGVVLHTRVRGWALTQIRDDDLDRVVDAAGLAGGWVDEARAIVEPDRTFEVAGACPVCRQRYVWVATDDGPIRKAALQITYSSRSARCINPSCSGRWPYEYLDHLARVVVQDRQDRQTG